MYYTTVFWHYRRGALEGYGPDIKSFSQASHACSISYAQRLETLLGGSRQTPNNAKVMRWLWSSHSSSSILTAANHKLQTPATPWKNAVYSMCPVEAPSLCTLHINLFKKQEVISVPLYREEVRVPHHWNSYKPLHRDIPLTGKSLEKPCKPDRPMCDLLLSSSSRSGQQQFATWVITAKSSHQKWWLFKMERKDTTERWGFSWRKR